MSNQPADAFTILRSLGFNPTAQGLDRAVAGLAKRLANYERALAETREMLADAEKRGAVKALREEADLMEGVDARVFGVVVGSLRMKADFIEAAGQVTL